MINCEKFESQYQQWNNSELPPPSDREMRGHRAQCSYCRTVNDDTIDLRNVIGSLPKHEPSIRFDYQLRRRINEIENSTQPQRRTSLLPRWAALGAGLATGLAVGIAVLLPLRQEGIDPLRGPGDLAVITAQQILPDSSVTPNDSLIDSDVQFHIDYHSQKVSSER